MFFFFYSKNRLHWILFLESFFGLHRFIFLFSFFLITLFIHLHAIKHPKTLNKFSLITEEMNCLQKYFGSLIIIKNSKLNWIIFKVIQLVVLQFVVQENMPNVHVVLLISHLHSNKRLKNFKYLIHSAFFKLWAYNLMSSLS